MYQGSCHCKMILYIYKYTFLQEFYVQHIMDNLKYAYESMSSEYDIDNGPLTNDSLRKSNGMIII